MGLRTFAIVLAGVTAAAAGAWLVSYAASAVYMSLLPRIRVKQPSEERIPTYRMT